MNRTHVRLGLALILALAIVSGVLLFVWWAPDLMAGKCTRAVLRQYDAVAEVIAIDINDVEVLKYDCDSGGYPALHFTISGSTSSVLDELACSPMENWPDRIVYRCQRPFLGYLDLKAGRFGIYNVGE